MAKKTEKVCKLKGCSKPAYAKKLCYDHYRQQWREGKRPPRTKVTGPLTIKTILRKPGDFDGEKIIGWCEDKLRIPETGAPLIFEPFQKNFIRRSFSKKGDGSRRYDTSVMSCGRKNAKTTTIAAIALACLAGPEAGIERIVTGSTDRASAGVIHEQAELMATWGKLLTDDNQVGLRCTTSSKKIRNEVTGGIYTTVSSDATHSLAYIPSLILIDELGYHPDLRLYNALNTSRGSHHPLMIIIGTRGPAGSPLNELIESISKSPDGNRYLELYALDDDDDPFNEQNWYKANPGLGTIRSLPEFRSFAETAKTSPADLAAMKAFYLNMVLDPGAEFLIGAEEWNRCSGEAEAKGPCYGGLDLAETRDLTAFVLFWPDTGRLETTVYIPAKPSLDERSARDDLPYDEFRQTGRLKVVGQVVADYGMIALDLARLHAEYHIEKIGIDPYKSENFITAAGKEGAVLPEIVKIKQGYLGMTGPIAELERRFIAGRIRHGDDPILKRAFSNAAIIKDGKLNRMFTKQREHRRIDPAVAAAMAVGVAAKATSPLLDFYRKQTATWYEAET